MRYWLNVDFPTNSAKLHQEGACQYVTGRYATARKDIGELKVDGGWLGFESEAQAKQYVGTHLGRRADFSKCWWCFT